MDAVLHEPATLTVRVADHETVGDISASVFDPDERRVPSGFMSAGEVTITGLGSGDYLVRATSQQHGFAQATVVATPGVTAEVDLLLATTYQMELKLVNFPSPLYSPLITVVTDERGRNEASDFRAGLYDPRHPDRRRIAPGTWTVRAEAPGVAPVERTFTIAEPGTTVVELDFRP